MATPRSKLSKPDGKKSNSPTLTFPTLHEDVLQALSEDLITPTPWFNDLGTSQEPMIEYSTHVMGQFRCYNQRCAKPGWGSKKVTIVIRRFPGNGYDAVVYKQRCKACDKLGAMRLDENSCVERVADRLKKWAGVEMETQGYVMPKDGPEHEWEFCEGCKAGVCTAA
jgi:hypothetical protein